MSEFLGTIEFWHWWVLAALLITIEIFAPTTVFLWTGISAVAVGLMLFVAESTSWQLQLLVFSALSVGSVLGWRQYARLRPTRSEEPTLNRRAEQYVGRQLTLDNPIVNGEGRITIDDTAWRIEGGDLEAGARVKVVGVDGATLRVEKT